MKLYFAADHAGFTLKAEVLDRLSAQGYEIEDCGAFTYDPDDDYPAIVSTLTARVLADTGSLGIVFAGSGQGEGMAANRILGIRAAVFYGPRAALTELGQEGGRSQDGYDGVRLTRQHNNANVLSIGARFVSVDEAEQAIEVFASTGFSGSARHVRRIEQF